ncbi:MAG TPA: helix-turn-helix domain-containing protein [Dehalococcoidia bacterium]
MANADASPRVSMTVTQAARRLSMPARTLQRMCRDGRIEAFLDGKWYITEAGLRRYVEDKGCSIADGVSSPERDAKLRRLMRLVAEVNEIAAELLEG